MTRVNKRQAFVCVLIGFLVYGLTWSGLFLNAAEANQVKMLDSVKESPLHNGESYPASSLLWQVNKSDIAFAQGVTGVSSNKILIKSRGKVGTILCYCHHNTSSIHAEITLRIIDGPNTVLKFINGQIYQYLDIPPPHALASL